MDVYLSSLFNYWTPKPYVKTPATGLFNLQLFTEEHDNVQIGLMKVCLIAYVVDHRRNQSILNCKCNDQLRTSHSHILNIPLCIKLISPCHSAILKNIARHECVGNLTRIHRHLNTFLYSLLVEHVGPVHPELHVHWFGPVHLPFTQLGLHITEWKLKL